jgi:hypothetical protein
MAEGDLAGVHSTLEGAGDIKGEQALWKLGELAKRRANLGDALTDHIDPEEAYRAKAASMGRDAASVAETIEQRTAESEAAKALSATEQNLPDPALGERALRWLAGKGDLGKLAPVQKGLGQRSRQLGQLEAQLRGDPGNQAAQDALDRLAYTIPPASPLKQGIANSAAIMSARGNSEVLGPVVGDALRNFTSSSGHELEDKITEVLSDDPNALGQYGQRLAEAKAKGGQALGAELLKLNSDPQWRELRGRFQPAH